MPWEEATVPSGGLGRAALFSRTGRSGYFLLGLGLRRDLVPLRIAPVVAAGALDAVLRLDQHPAVPRARLLERLLPHREVTLRVSVAPVEHVAAPAPCLLDDEVSRRIALLLPALRTGDADL